MDIPNISEQILKLEESLLHEDFSSNPEALEAMISNDFREIDPKGRECSREDVIAWLLQKNPAPRWELSAFSLHQLADNSVLATYHARQIQPESSSSGSRHCSIWHTTYPSTNWQLFFHQSTKIV